MRKHTFLLATALALAPVAAGAQAVSVPLNEVGSTTPPATSQSTIGLSDAVAHAIRSSPRVQREMASLARAQGRLRESAGLFDSTLRAGGSFDLQLQQLTPSLLSREVSKRASIQIVANVYGQLTAALRDVIRNLSTAPPRCPTIDVNTPSETLRLEGRDASEAAALGTSRDLEQLAFIDLGLGDVDLSNICGTQVEPLFSPEAFADVWRRIDQSGGLGLGGILTSVAQIPTEARTLQAEITEAIAFRAQLALDRLSTLPKDDIKRNIGLNASIGKALRSGMAVSAGYELQTQEQNFVDKPMDPSFGGMESPPQFFSTLTFSLDVPLARGRGSAAAASAERSARSLLAAQTYRLRHAISEEAYRTTVAYINLIGAQESSTLLSEALKRHQQLASLTQQRVTGGDLAQSEAGRAQARVASTTAAAAEARAAVREAQFALADAAGFNADSFAAATAALGTFVTTTTQAGAIQELLRQAREARLDLKSLEENRNAAAAVAAGARANARPRIDLRVSAGLSNLYESPFFKYLWDEQRDVEGSQLPIISATRAVPVGTLTGTSIPPPTPGPVRFYSPRGGYRAISSRHEPFVLVEAKFELPFGNNSAKGRSAQAEATYRSSVVTAVDLGRTIDQSVLGVADGLTRTASSLTSATQAITELTTALNGTTQRFQAGDATLLNVLTTEDSMLGDRLRLISQRQAYLSLLARLRFETGRLVTFDGTGSAETARFVPTEFATR